MTNKKDLRKYLSPKAYDVTQKAKTERPFTGKYDNFYQEGIYVDVVSGEPLFSSKDKYDANCGWPSFTKPINQSHIKKNEDHSFLMERTEVKSKNASSHLGHVFDDGPKKEGGRRYCINSAALRFIPVKDLEKLGYGKYVRLFK